MKPKCMFEPEPEPVWEFEPEPDWELKLDAESPPNHVSSFRFNERDLIKIAEKVASPFF